VYLFSYKADVLIDGVMVPVERVEALATIAQVDHALEALLDNVWEEIEEHPPARGARLLTLKVEVFQCRPQ